jgi:DNA topoisomerase VI subunit B
MTTATETIATIKSVSNDIEAAITAGRINEAIELENKRHAKINSLASMDLEEITPEVREELTGILSRIQEDIDVLEAAMHELNKTTGKQVRRLNGYR